MSAIRIGKVPVTNLDRILYPELQVTKKDVIEYYIRAAPRILPFLDDRQLVMERFPDGVDHPGFYEKDAPQGTPSWVKLVSRYSETVKREIHYVVCNDTDTLIWLANLAALELNIMLSRIESLATPDMLFFDIDPEPPAGFLEAADSALLLRELLVELGLASFPKTSGKKGIHVVVPLARVYGFAKVRNFVHAIGILLSKRSPVIVSELSQTRNPGTVFIDYLQNTEGKTMISPYSLRSTSQATVSMPLSWQEVGSVASPGDFTIRTAAFGKDPWKGFFENREKLPEAGT
jgi:bifunctional non-homologous end joining protein LigD